MFIKQVWNRIFLACAQKKLKHYEDSLNNFQKAVNIR